MIQLSPYDAIYTIIAVITLEPQLFTYIFPGSYALGFWQTDKTTYSFTNPRLMCPKTDNKIFNA